MQEVQHGVHYLVDYYAVLGVDRKASTAEIETALKAKFKQYHPDRFQGLAPEFQARSEAMTLVLTEAKEHLTTGAKRAAYDKRLSEWEGPISESGCPVVDASRPDWAASVMQLLVLGSPTAEREFTPDTHLEQQILAMTGFNQAIHDLLKQQYEATDEPSPELEAAYRESLAQLDQQLAIRESFLQQEVGADSTIDIHPPKAYLEEAKARVAQQREVVLRDVEQTILALHAGEIRLLEEGDVSVAKEIEDDPSQALERYRNVAARRFDERAAAILELAEERDKVIDLRVELVKGEYRPEQPVRFKRVAVCIVSGESRSWVAAKLEGSSIVADDSITKQRMSELEDPVAAAALIAEGCNVMFFTLEEGLPFEESLNEVLSNHFDPVVDD
jgi:curved DNA-binding protein CbpA